MLGLAVGRALVITEGRAVGTRLGLHVVQVVGLPLGRAVGSSVGLTVGLNVFVGPLVLGWLVGCGETDGAEVGLLLGCPMGSLEVCELGRPVGVVLGGKVG